MVPFERPQTPSSAARGNLRAPKVHRYLHPGNVLFTERGPVVIDWEGAGIGGKDVDTAVTWLLLEVGEPDHIPIFVRPIAGLIRRIFVRAFLRGVDKPSAATIAAVCKARLLDKNMKPQELDRVRAFASEHAA